MNFWLQLLSVQSGENIFEWIKSPIFGYVYFKFKKTKLSEIPELPHVWIHYQCRNPEMNLKSIKQVENVSVLPSGIVFNLFDLISGILDEIDRTIILLLRLPSNQEKGNGAFWPSPNFIFYFRAKQGFLFFFVLSKLVGNGLCCHLIQLHIEHVLLSFYVKQEKAIELLVEHGADLDSRTPYGESPLGMGWLSTLWNLENHVASLRKWWQTVWLQIISIHLLSKMLQKLILKKGNCKFYCQIKKTMNSLNVSGMCFLSSDKGNQVFAGHMICQYHWYAL